MAAKHMSHTTARLDFTNKCCWTTAERITAGFLRLPPCLTVDNKKQASSQNRWCGASYSILKTMPGKPCNSSSWPWDAWGSARKKLQEKTWAQKCGATGHRWPRPSAQLNRKLDPGYCKYIFEWMRERERALHFSDSTLNTLKGKTLWKGALWLFDFREFNLRIPFFFESFREYGSTEYFETHIVWWSHCGSLSNKAQRRFTCNVFFSTFNTFTQQTSTACPLYTGRTRVMLVES